MGECPDWYALLIESKRLRVAPWELARQHPWWRSVARSAIEAENYALDQRNRLAATQAPPPEG